MKAACFVGKKKVRVEEVPEPQILNDHDAIVRVTSTAICASDVHLVDGAVPALESGDILGHEFMGEVVELGPAVRTLSVGDRVVVPLTIACGACISCRDQQFSLCENSNPNAWLAERLLGHAPAGVFGSSHLLGGFAGGQAEYVRVPFADVGPIRVPPGLSDDQVLLLSDVLPTAYMGAELCELGPGDVVAVWGAGPLGLLTMACARLLGAERVIAIDRHLHRLERAIDAAGATDLIDERELDVREVLQTLTGGRGPDACIDTVGVDARPLREAIRACRNGGVVAFLGDHAGTVDGFPLGAIRNRSISLRSGLCHVQRYLAPLLARIADGELDPSFVISHHLRLDEAALGYALLRDRPDACLKVVLQA